MSKSTKAVTSTRTKSAKIRNHDLNAAPAAAPQRKQSKTKLDDIHEFRQSKNDDANNHVQFASENNVTIVKENEKPLKSAMGGGGGGGKSKKIGVSNKVASELTSENSFDSNEVFMKQEVVQVSVPSSSSSRKNSVNNEHKSLKDRWKIAFQSIKQKFQSKPKYDEIEEIESNELDNGQDIEAYEEEEATKLNSSGNVRITSTRRSTSTNYDGVTAQRRHTKESMDDSKATEKKFHNNHSYIRSAIPCFPLTLAIICFMLNVLLPGTGTILSGVLIMCFGESRLATKSSGQKATTLVVNLLVGIGQFLTIILLLVGWFWSIAWGVYIVIIALEKRRQIEKQKLRKKNRELKVTALKALGLKAL